MNAVPLGEQPIVFLTAFVLRGLKRFQNELERLQWFTPMSQLPHHAHGSAFRTRMFFDTVSIRNDYTFAGLDSTETLRRKTDQIILLSKVSNLTAAAAGHFPREAHLK